MVLSEPNHENRQDCEATKEVRNLSFPDFGRVEIATV